jgi:hypothetical protein
MNGLNNKLKEKKTENNSIISPFKFIIPYEYEWVR